MGARLSASRAAAALAAAGFIVFAILATFHGVVAANASAGDGKIVVMLDLAHGESDKYVNYIVGNLSDIADFVLLKNATITPEALGNVDVLIIGQPTASFSSDEIQAIVSWLESGPKVLWIAGDSDYGSGSQVQEIVNSLLEAVGSHLRLEMGAVYDQVHNAGAFYRVLGQVLPDDKPEYNTSIIAQNITKPVLYHGPTVLIWEDDQGNYHDLATETLPTFIRIVWTYNTSYIADNTPPALVYYDPTIDKNRTFVMLAAEVMDDDIIVASGESPYGDYEPTWSWEYHGVQLDGPQFIKNMVLWFKWWIENGGQPVQITTTTTPAQTTTSQSPTSTGTTTSAGGTTTAQSPTQTGTSTSPSPTSTGTTTQGAKSNTALIAGVIIVVIVIAVAAALLARR